MQQIRNIEKFKTVDRKNGERMTYKNHKNNVIRINNYDDIFDEETIRCLLKSEEDIEKGRTRKAAEVIEELKAKYGF